MPKYIWPVPQGTPVTQSFGASPGGYNPVGGHTGTDFGVPLGTPIRAIADGVVTFADWATTLPADYRADGSGPNPYWLAPTFGGIVVTIDHGDVITVSAHLSKTALNRGDRVHQGDVIGYSGMTGAASGPHLHFETIPDGWNFNSGTYGRVNPNRYCTGYWAGITGQNTTITPIKEDTLSAAEVTEIKNYMHALLIGGYTSGGKAHPGGNMVAEENQRRIAAIPAGVWATTVARGGGKVSALQELADAKTAAQAVRAENTALREALTQLAKAPGVAIDYGKVEAAVAKALKDGTVQVDVTVAGGK